MTHGNGSSVLTIISNLFLLFFYGLLPCVNDVGEINNCIGSVISKENIIFLSVLILTLFVAVLPVKYPGIIRIIAIGAPLVLVVVAGHGECCHDFRV